MATTNNITQAKGVSESGILSRLAGLKTLDVFVNTKRGSVGLKTGPDGAISFAFGGDDQNKRAENIKTMLYNKSKELTAQRLEAEAKSAMGNMAYESAATQQGLDLESIRRAKAMSDASAAYSKAEQEAIAADRMARKEADRTNGLLLLSNYRDKTGGTTFERDVEAVITGAKFATTYNNSKDEFLQRSASEVATEINDNYLDTAAFGGQPVTIPQALAALHNSDPLMHQRALTFFREKGRNLSDEQIAKIMAESKPYNVGLKMFNAQADRLKQEDRLNEIKTIDGDIAAFRSRMKGLEDERKKDKNPTETKNKLYLDEYNEVQDQLNGALKRRSELMPDYGSKKKQDVQKELAAKVGNLMFESSQIPRGSEDSEATKEFNKRAKEVEAAVKKAGGLTVAAGTAGVTKPSILWPDGSLTTIDDSGPEQKTIASRQPTKRVVRPPAISAEQNMNRWPYTAAVPQVQ